MDQRKRFQIYKPEEVISAIRTSLVKMLNSMAVFKNSNPKKYYILKDAAVILMNAKEK